MKENVKALGARLQSVGKRLSTYLSKYGIFIPIGLVLAGVTMTIAIIIAQIHMQDTESLRSPQYEPGGNFDFAPDESNTFTAEDGVIVIPAQNPADKEEQTGDPDEIWRDDQVVTYNSFTTQDAIIQDGGSLGVLSIPALDLSVGVYQAENEMEAMTQGLAHFAISSSWDGNVAVCGHNVNFDLSDGYLKNLHLIASGAEVRYSTELGERIYEVQEIKEISDEDWSYLRRTVDNRLTIITCITGKPEKRLMVQAVEK